MERFVGSFFPPNAQSLLPSPCIRKYILRSLVLVLSASYLFASGCDMDAVEFYDLLHDVRAKLLRTPVSWTKPEKCRGT